MSGLFAPVTSLLKSLSQRGAKGTLLQLYTIGDIKLGDLKGTDKWGNKYYENPSLPYGQHRWVEYADIHNPDPTMISPEWHGWMHHVFEETPDLQNNMNGKFTPVAQESHANCNTHLGLIVEKQTGPEIRSHNTSQYRLRGYKTGSLFTGPEDKDQYYKQPGHPLSDKNGRFNGPKGYSEFVESEEAKRVARNLRKIKNKKNKSEEDD